MHFLRAGLAFATVVAAMPAHSVDDRKEYLLHCSGCHGVSGHGLPSNGIPDLHDAGRWLGLTAGREYLVQVPGISATGLDDELAARMLNYALRTYSADQLSASFQPFTAEEVHRLRTNVATDADRRRQNLDAMLAVRGR
jgi:mono/diheme cytochrome c family protein